MPELPVRFRFFDIQRGMNLDHQLTLARNPPQVMDTGKAALLIPAIE
jgi:hypothetical protein